MVVGKLLSKVEVKECKDIDIGEVPVVQDVGWHKVEVARVPADLGIEVSVYQPKMTELMDQCRTLAISLESPCDIQFVLVS